MLAFETAATAAYVFDESTGTVLLAKNADEPLPPASMSKLMTIYLAFEAIAEAGWTSTRSCPFPNMPRALADRRCFWIQPTGFGSRICCAASSCCRATMQALCWPKPCHPMAPKAGFARLMTERAHELGMAQSTFVNASGWPAAGHRMSMRDLGILAHR